MKDDTALDYAQFSLSSSSPSRCELLVSAGGEKEKILSGGFCIPFVGHLQALQEDGTVRLELKRDPVGSQNERTWFTKGTLERFAKFVMQPEVLEHVKSIEEEVTQLEQVRNIQVEDKLLHPQSIAPGMHQLDDKVVSSRLQAENGVHTKSRQCPGGEIDSGTKAPKRQLLRAMDARVHALRLEQETAFACARAAGYDDAGIEDLLSFANYFGANRLREACIQFSSLLRKTAIAVADEGEALVQHNHAGKSSICTTIVHVSHFKNDFREEEEEKEEGGEVYTRMAGEIYPSSQYIPLPKLESLEDAESPHDSFQSNYHSGYGCKTNDSVEKMEIIGLGVDKTIGEDRVSFATWESSCLPSYSTLERSRESWGSPFHHSLDIRALVGIVDLAIGDPSQDSRGRLYEQYRKLRDAKLREEEASKRAERELKLKAMEETLDRRKAEMETRNTRPLPKRNNSRFIRRVPLPLAEKFLVAQDIMPEDDKKGQKVQEPKEEQSNGYSRSSPPVSLDSFGIKVQSPTERSGNSAKKPVSVLSPKPLGQRVQEPKKEQGNGYSKSSSTVSVISSGIKVQSPTERSGNSAKKHISVLSLKPPVTSSTASPKQSMKKKLPPTVAEEDPLPCVADSRKEVAKPSSGQTLDAKLPPKLPLRGSSGDSNERIPLGRKSRAALNLTLTLTEVKALPSSKEGGLGVIAAPRKKVAAVVVEKPKPSSVHGRIRRRNAVAPLQEAAKPFLRKGRGIGPGGGSNAMKLKAGVDTAKTSSDEGVSSTTLTPSVVAKDPGYSDESVLKGPPLQPSGLCELDGQREKTNVIHKELLDIASPDQSQEKREKSFPDQLNKGVVPSSFIASDSVEVVTASVSFHSSSLLDELGADSTIFASPSTILSGAQSCSIISGSEFRSLSSPTALEDPSPPAHSPASNCSAPSTAEIACHSKKWVSGGSEGVLRNKPAQSVREPVKGFKRFFKFGRKNRPSKATAAATTATTLPVDDESVLSEPSEVNGDADEQRRKGERQSIDDLLRVPESGTELGNKPLTLGDLCSIHEQEMAAGHSLQRSIPGNLKPQEDRLSGGSLLKGLSLFKTACFSKNFTNSCYYDLNAL